LAAALTVLRAWHVANEAGRLPTQKHAMGSFEKWSYRIREPLIWLGRADPCETIKEVKGGDLRRLAHIAVHAQWRRELGTESSYTVGQVINRAAIVGEFHTALMNVAAPRTGNMVSNGGLGRWLGSGAARLCRASQRRGGGADYQWFRIEDDGDQGRLFNLEIGRLLK
jgi:putative DNA primase/helicase